MRKRGNLSNATWWYNRNTDYIQFSFCMQPTVLCVDIDKYVQWCLHKTCLTIWWFLETWLPCFTPIHDNLWMITFWVRDDWRKDPMDWSESWKGWLFHPGVWSWSYFPRESQSSSKGRVQFGSQIHKKMVLYRLQLSIQYIFVKHVVLWLLKPDTQPDLWVGRLAIRDFKLKTDTYEPHIPPGIWT